MLYVRFQHAWGMKHFLLRLLSDIIETFSYVLKVMISLIIPVLMWMFCLFVSQGLAILFIQLGRRKGVRSSGIIFNYFLLHTIAGIFRLKSLISHAVREVSRKGTYILNIHDVLMLMLHMWQVKSRFYVMLTKKLVLAIHTCENGLLPWITAWIQIITYQTAHWPKSRRLRKIQVQLCPPSWASDNASCCFTFNDRIQL